MLSYLFTFQIYHIERPSFADINIVYSQESVNYRLTHIGRDRIVHALGNDLHRHTPFQPNAIRIGRLFYCNSVSWHNLTYIPNAKETNLNKLLATESPVATSFIVMLYPWGSDALLVDTSCLLARFKLLLIHRILSW